MIELLFEFTAMPLTPTGRGFEKRFTKSVFPVQPKKPQHADLAFELRHDVVRQGAALTLR
jgi:hypothetical protein